MKVTIDSFRHHASYTVDVKRGSITLISGQSGIGKSTIFRAMQWCLYGKLQHYTPILKPRARTTVTITYPLSSEETWEIMRQGHPNLFRITIGENVYSGTDAEALVLEHFGNEDVFLSCCYLEQMNRNHLLSLPQTERLKVLHHLSFSSTSPEEIKRVLAVAISETKKEFDALKIKHITSSNELERFSPLIGDEEKANTIYNLSREEIEGNIATTTASIKELEVKQKKREQALALSREYEEKEATYTQQLLRLEAKLREYPPEDVLEARTESLKRKQRAKEQEAERERLAREVSELEKRMEEAKAGFYSIREDSSDADRQDIETWTMNPKHTREAYDQAVKHEDLLDYGKGVIKESFREHTRLRGSMESYSTEGVIKDLETILAQQEYLDIKTRISKLKDHHSISEAMEKKERALAAIRRINSYSCPHCKNLFALENGTAVAVDTTGSKEEGDLATLRKKLQDADVTIRDLEMEAKEKKDLERRLDKLNPVPEDIILLDPVKRSHAISLLDKLRNLPRKLSTPEFASGAIWASFRKKKYHEDYHDTKREHSRKKHTLDLFPPSDPTSLEPILPEETRAANDRKEFHQIQGRYKELGKQLKAISNNITSFTIPPDLSTELSKVRLSKEELQSLLKQKDIVDKVAELQSEVDEMDTQMDTLIDKYKELNTIMEVAKQIEHEVLTSVVEGINENLAVIGGKLFDTPINLQLKLDRELKTRVGTKPDVNISITYQGAEYKLNQLSGGEQDRVSLALLLALSQLSSVGFLLLDEASAYLDQEYRERVVDVLRTFCGDKCILSIEHEAVSGLYDKEIVLEG